MMSNLLKVTFIVNGSPKTVEVDTRDSLLDGTERLAQFDRTEKGL